MPMFDSSRSLKRRDALRLIGGAAGLGAFGSMGKGGNLFEAASLGAAADVKFPKGAIIRTVLKDYAPEALGVILFHEHVQLSSTFGLKGGPGAPQPTQSYSEDIDLVVNEVKEAQKDGVSCLVDGGHLDQGRRAEYVKQVAKLSGVPIVMSGGYHSQPSYPAEVIRGTEDDLLDEFVRYSVAERWGAFGEIGTSAEITPDERKVLRAIGRAHVRTNIPIFSHTANGLSAIEQLDLFESVGVKPANLIIGHMGALKMVSIDIFKTICKRGAFVGFDRTGGTNPASDDAQVVMIKDLIAAGYADNIVLASDGGSQEAQMKAKGGPGHARTYTVFVPKLRAAGVDDATVKKITVDNPRRFLAFVPKIKTPSYT